jgi:16S rRNA (guanine527-N7)-methyltransferase
MDPTLRKGAAAIGVELNQMQYERLLMHLDILDEWSSRMNLTAIRDRPSQLTKHVLDSLSVVPWLHGAACADIGSGAGFPGIPLAIVEPNRQFTLIESTGKKARFLAHVCQVLNLGNVSIVHSRAEQYRPAVPFSTVLARAVGSLARLMDFSRSLVGAGGTLLAMKGRIPKEELDGGLRGWRLVGVHHLVVPGLDEERHLIELRRSRDKSR